MPYQGRYEGVYDRKTQLGLRNGRGRRKVFNTSSDPCSDRFSYWPDLLQTHLSTRGGVYVQRGGFPLNIFRLC